MSLDVFWVLTCQNNAEEVIVFQALFQNSSISVYLHTCYSSVTDVLLLRKAWISQEEIPHRQLRKLQTAVNRRDIHQTIIESAIGNASV